MTNEEAYEILKNSECFGAVELYRKDEIEAFNVALEALKAEPCGDAVSRKHLLSEIDKLMQSPWFNNGKDFYDGTNTHYGYVERKEAVEIVRDMCIKAEPPVTPKTGKWEEFDYGMGIIFLKCPFCGEFQSKAYNHNFCPNCGAKMEGESK